MIEKFNQKISPAGKFKNEGYHDDPYLRSLITKEEKIATKIYGSSTEGSKALASEIASIIKIKELESKKCVLGLAVGSAPSEVYDELVSMHKKDGLSFKNVIVFNVMEYYPIAPNALQSFSRNISEKFYDRIDIPKENIFGLDATLPQEKIYDFCRTFEEQIEKVGGIDMQILGIGGTGHIGLNEPGSSSNSLTRIVSLDDITRTVAASDFFGKDNVPRKAITMGITTILKAKRIRVLAWGEGKAAIIQKTVEGEISEEVPSSFLQKHENCHVIVDEAAGNELTRVKTPWLIDSVVWNDRLVKKAVVWLCQQVNKPILKLTDRDYNDNGMGDIIAEKGSAYQVNIRIFNELQHTITGWPGGKPNADDTYRPERKSPDKKKVIIFSPHPDDDVISMGGTMLRLVDQGHDVHVAYQVSGNLAVSDDDVLRYIDFIGDYTGGLNLDSKQIKAEHDKIRKFIANKKHDQIDLPEIRRIKTLIRVGEAKAGCRYANVKESNTHFLNLPFYETGGVEKKPIGKEDVKIIADLIKEVKPHQIFAAGDLSDPHGTHRVCLDAIFQAIDQLKKEEWMKDCWVWLYRGAWHEWEIHNIEMAVPISPDELMRKRNAIFKHQSQKDGAMFLGGDSREFWQRAEDRNRGTAQLYNELGMAEYEAFEAFVRYEFL
ncbi:glucosamine-6-phosphate deaminase [Carboxylicivirga linearis]|uniref:Glucosamine-6-phosphate deaminase n=1 Tax=Carboxylicivirga linearis TaxID=1628157 RepID=A0ABS5JSV9_9BACT|nr:glucosamine-6-phosphate deaminase [Carboxylicivirga linearis]MBS2097614.1 glucosamine-6-phosphate deaminase [Carboxylicivirga linearis]